MMIDNSIGKSEKSITKNITDGFSNGKASIHKQCIGESIRDGKDSFITKFVNNFSLHDDPFYKKKKKINII